MKVTKVILTITIISLVGCARHNIAGTSYGWNSSEYKVISDSVTNDLQIRRVRFPSASCVQGFNEHLELNGSIGADSTYIIGEHLKIMPVCEDKKGTKYVTTVYMNSLGGYVEHGYALGRLFKKHGVHVKVTGEQVCASSCAIAFLGAKYRSVYHNGILLFHAPYTLTQNEFNEKITSCNSNEQETKLKTYYIEMLGKELGMRIFNRTMTYCSNTKGWLLNADAAKIYNITTFE